MMNLEKMQMLHDYLATHDARQFNMEFFFIPFSCGHDEHKCGTASCIAGWAISLFDKQFIEDSTLPDGSIEYGNQEAVTKVAADILGLSNEQATWLFYGKFSGAYYNGRIDMRDIKLEDAVAALKYLIDGGVVMNESGYWAHVEDMR